MAMAVLGAFWPRIEVPGSPGVSAMIEKITKVTPNRIGIKSNSRFATYLYMIRA